LRKRKLQGNGDLFQRANHGDGVQVVEVANVSDAEERALHLPLPIGDDDGEFRAETLDDQAGIDAFGGRIAVAAAASKPLGANSFRPIAVAAARVIAAQVSALSTSFLRPSTRFPSA